MIKISQKIIFLFLLVFIAFSCKKETTSPAWKSFRPTYIGNAHINITSIAIDKHGNKWVGANIGIMENGFLSKFDGTNWTYYGISGYYVSTIIIDAHDTKCYATPPFWDTNVGGVPKLDSLKSAIYFVSNSGLIINIIAITKDSKGNKWFACGGGISELEN